ncbi:MAG: tRNA(Ile)-lysidine synthase [Verrucomicrobiota bacterium]
MLPLARLHPSTLAWAADRSTREPWGIAFSGGADSLALLLVLWAHFPSRRGQFVALHFDHRLRGKESRADAAFSRRVCTGLKIAFRKGSWLGAPKAASEADAREARMGFLEKHASVLWFGHQLDDVAETMLMRLARGSGAGGLAAPRPIQTSADGVTRLRPLLTLRKGEIQSALQAATIPWREDSSNLAGDYFRNRIRQAVVPAWNAAAQRDAVAGAARSRELLEEDDTALECWLDGLGAMQSDRALNLRLLVDKPRALIRRAVHRWLLLQPDAGKISRQAFDLLLASATKGAATRHSLGAKGFAVIKHGLLCFVPVRKRS